jgi:hypothetical protein
MECGVLSIVEPFAGDMLFVACCMLFVMSAMFVKVIYCSLDMASAAQPFL